MLPTDLVREHIATASAALAAVAREVESYREVSDSDLLELADANAMVGRMVSSNGARIAGEIARRSAPSLGYQGLAQRTGHRTPEELVRVTTGQSRQEAFTAVRVGRLTTDAADAATPDPVTGELLEPTRPWLMQLGRAVSEGTLSPAAADAIAHGLGEPDAAVSVAELTSAVEGLCLLAGDLDVDRLFRRARELRLELDADSVAEREAALRAARSVKFFRQADGTAKLIWVMDPETAAVVGELFDRATSPRLGGPRFVSGDDHDHAKTIAEDTRTTEQLVSDVFVELLRQGAAADSSQLLGTGAPVIRLLVAQTALETRTGHGRLEVTPTQSVSPPLSGTPARPICRRSSSARTGNPSMWVAMNACSRSGNGKLSPPAMAGACTGIAIDHRVGAKHTTSTTGPETTAEPISPTASSFADITICCFITTIGKSNARAPIIS